MTQPKPRLVATIIWASLLAGPTLFLGVALYLVLWLRSGIGLAGVVQGALAPVASSAVLSVVTVALSWRWAVRMPRPAPRGVSLRGGAIPPGPEADAVRRLIVACALCEGSAVFAVIVFLLTGTPLVLWPFALSWLALAAHFPGERHWARLTGSVGRNTMIRS